MAHSEWSGRGWKENGRPRDSAWYSRAQGWREVGGKMRMKVGTFVADDGIGFGTLKGPRTLRFLLPIITRTKGINARALRYACSRDIHSRLCMVVYGVCGGAQETFLWALRGRQSRWLDELIVLRGWEKLFPWDLNSSRHFTASTEHGFYFFFLTKTKRDVFAYLNFTF